MAVLTGDGRVLDSSNGPMGVRKISVDGSNCQPDENGRIHFRLRVDEAEGAAADTEWWISYMLLHLTGVVE